MKQAKYAFMLQRISDPERLWLGEMAKPNFDERIARVRLGTQLPIGFDPKTIDRKLCSDGRLTLLGLWHAMPNADVFSSISALISEIQSRMRADPYRTKFSADEISEAAALPFSRVQSAIDELQRVPTYAPVAAIFDRVTHRTSGELSVSIDSSATAEPFIACKNSDDFLEWLYKKIDAFQKTLQPPQTQSAAEAHAGQVPIRPGTAFVIMAMDPRKPELDDVYSAIRSVCADFGVDARRADKFEHDELITDLILREIRTSEFLIADLTYERPNVYYEVGYAHALKKRPILFRREGTPLHFDLAVHNAREYRNLEHLKDQLQRRLAAIFDKDPGREGATPTRKRGSASAKAVTTKLRKIRKGAAPNRGEGEGDA